jgi:hypothetical protein
MLMKDIAGTGHHAPLSAKVFECERIVKDVVRAAKLPGYSQASWAPLAALIAVDEFERVGIWREVMTWQDYLEFLTQWALTKDFETSLRRITETRDTVFFEIEERHVKGGVVTIINSMNVYVFNDAGKIRRLDVYYQGRLEPSVPLKAAT